MLSPSNPLSVGGQSITKTQEETIWIAVAGSRRPSRDQQKACVLLAAVELEGDLFWACVTEEGYLIWSAVLKDKVAKLGCAKDASAQAGGEEVVGALRRAAERVKHSSTRQGQGKRTRVDDD